MQVFLGTDHAGFAHKEAVKQALLDDGIAVTDCGAHTYEASDDFPDFIAPTMEKLQAAPESARAIIFGGSGQGEAMLANAYPGVRAAVYYGGAKDIVTLSREHNDANVLSLGARFVSEDEAVATAQLWLATPFSNEQRHVRRIQKIVRQTH